MHEMLSLIVFRAKIHSKTVDFCWTSLVVEAKGEIQIFYIFSKYLIIKIFLDGNFSK